MALLPKKVVAFVIFVVIALVVSSISPSTEISWVVAILLLTIYLFAFEIVEIDVAAITIMVLLGLSSLDFFQSITGINSYLVAGKDLFSGFSSNAVISIIAVMIIGAGIDKTGLMIKVAQVILNIGGKSEKKIIPIVSGTVGIISSFMQNVGAAALFIPAVSRIANSSGLPISRLLMPMGFTAILGGTITMVGSSPLILLNDLIVTSNKVLPSNQHMDTWGLFAVTPIGLALVAVGIIYFVIFGKYVLPKDKTQIKPKTTAVSYFKKIYGINYSLFEVSVSRGSDIVGKNLLDIEILSKIRIVAIKVSKGNILIGKHSISRDTVISEDMVLGIISSEKSINSFVDRFSLSLSSKVNVFADLFSSSNSGMAEIVIPPSSSFIGKSAKDIFLRKVYGMAVVAFHRSGNTLGTGSGIRDLKFKSGDTLVVYTKWQDLESLEGSRDFLVLTSDYPHKESLRPEKLTWALISFSCTMGLILFTNIKLSIALLTGAIIIILSGVLKIEEAYKAVSWKTVFLLASLIPLGLAVETTGTAKWIAGEILLLLGGMPLWVIQAVLAVLATFFTLVISNIGATVLLVPIAINIAISVGANPAIFALTVAIATSNSFLIPTHQVNVLIMSPGGYRVSDFLRAGGIMTVLFLLVMLVTMNLIF